MKSFQPSQVTFRLCWGQLSSHSHWKSLLTWSNWNWFNLSTGVRLKRAVCNSQHATSMPPPVTLPQAILPLSIRKQWFTPMQSNSSTFFLPARTPCLYRRSSSCVFQSSDMCVWQDGFTSILMCSHRLLMIVFCNHEPQCLFKLQVYVLPFCNYSTVIVY